MPILNLIGEGSMTVDGIAMANTFGAWGIVADERGKGGLVPLWTDFAVRGENRILPSVTGVIMYEHRVTETRYDFRLLVTGDVDGQTGATPTDAIEGLEANLDYLVTNIIEPPGTSTGTRAAVITKPSGATVSADIQSLGTTVQTYLLQDCASLWIATWHIDIPAGRFT
jgi:hypothetical protein